MVHNLVPSDAERHAFLKQLLSSEVRSYIAEYLEDPSTYYDALEELMKRYGQPQVVARSHTHESPSYPRRRSSRLGKIEPDSSWCYARIKKRWLPARFGIWNDAGAYGFSSTSADAQQLGNKGESYDTQPSYSFRFS